MALLKQSRVPPSSHAEYLQWLRYYLAFCDRYSPPEAKSDRLPPCFPQFRIDTHKQFVYS